MSHKDISFLHALIADDVSDFLSLLLDSHMNHTDISSLHVLVDDDDSDVLFF